MAACAALAAASITVGAQAPDNVLLITLDTFRGDYLGANGSKRAETPCLDRLAAAGANFTRARAHVPLTLPSHASILTGLHPHSHGVRTNGAAALGAEALTLAEVLRAEGFATAAFVGSFVLDRRFGLDQGFEHYDDRVAQDLAMLERPEAERDGADVLGAFETWLAGWLAEGRQAEAGSRFFSWIHLYDPHAPYLAPEPFRSRYPGDPYAAEIAYTDSLVCRAVAALEAGGVLEGTLVAAVGDHGEGLGEHSEATHSLLIYNSTLHVPMIVRAPGQRSAATVSDLVRTIDLAPTLLDYLGSSAVFGDGSSLRPLIERKPLGTSRPADSAARHSLSESLYAARTLGWSPLFGLEASAFRYLRAPEPELFDLERDPGETRNVIADFPEVAARLENRLASLLLGDRLEERPPERPLDAGEIEKLRSLGYLAGPATGSPPAGVVDPKTKIEVWERLQHGIALFGRSEHGSASLEFEKVLRTERDLPLLYEYLSASYVRLRAWEKFDRLQELAQARGVETAGLLLDLGRRLRDRSRGEQARAAFERALVLEPLSVTARYELAELHQAEGRLEAAVAAYREALAINPRHAFSWNGLGVALASSRERTGEAGRESRQAAALDAFERAVEFAPRDPRSVLNLAVQLERMGRGEAAIEQYRRCLDLSTEDVFAPARTAALDGIRRLQAEP